MYFLKKAWPFVVAAIVVSIGAFVLGRVNKPESSVVTIYKQVTPTPKANRAQGATAEVAGDVHTPPESTSETGYDRRAPIELRETGDESVASDAEGDANGSVIVKESMPHITKGEVPSELSREAMERSHKEYRQQQRILEIMEEMGHYANNSPTSREDAARFIELRQELLRIQQERGQLHQTGGDVFKTNEFFKMALTHTTDDGRFPTSKASILIEGIRENTPDSPEKRVALERLNRIVATAIENGDEYFDLNSNSNE